MRIFLHITILALIVSEAVSKRKSIKKVSKCDHCLRDKVPTHTKKLSATTTYNLRKSHKTYKNSKRNSDTEYYTDDNDVLVEFKESFVKDNRNQSDAKKNITDPNDSKDIDLNDPDYHDKHDSDYVKEIQENVVEIGASRDVRNQSGDIAKNKDEDDDSNDYLYNDDVIEESGDNSTEINYDDESNNLPNNTSGEGSIKKDRYRDNGRPQIDKYSESYEDESSSEKDDKNGYNRITQNVKNNRERETSNRDKKYVRQKKINKETKYRRSGGTAVPPPSRAFKIINKQKPHGQRKIRDKGKLNNKHEIRNKEKSSRKHGMYHEENRKRKYEISNERSGEKSNKEKIHEVTRKQRVRKENNGRNINAVKKPRSRRMSYEISGENNEGNTYDKQTINNDNGGNIVIKKDGKPIISIKGRVIKKIREERPRKHKKNHGRHNKKANKHEKHKTSDKHSGTKPKFSSAGSHENNINENNIDEINIDGNSHEKSEKSKKSSCENTHEEKPRTEPKTSSEDRVVNNNERERDREIKMSAEHSDKGGSKEEKKQVKQKMGNDNSGQIKDISRKNSDRSSEENRYGRQKKDSGETGKNNDNKKETKDINNKNSDRSGSEEKRYGRQKKDSGETGKNNDNKKDTKDINSKNSDRSGSGENSYGRQKKDSGDTGKKKYNKEENNEIKNKKSDRSGSEENRYVRQKKDGGNTGKNNDNRKENKDINNKKSDRSGSEENRYARKKKDSGDTSKKIISSNEDNDRSQSKEMISKHKTSKGHVSDNNKNGKEKKRIESKESDEGSREYDKLKLKELKKIIKEFTKHSSQKLKYSRFENYDLNTLKYEKTMETLFPYPTKSETVFLENKYTKRKISGSTKDINDDIQIKKKSFVKYTKPNHRYVIQHNVNEPEDIKKEESLKNEPIFTQPDTPATIPDLSNESEDTTTLDPNLDYNYDTTPTTQRDMDMNAILKQMTHKHILNNITDLLLEKLSGKYGMKEVLNESKLAENENSVEKIEVFLDHDGDMIHGVQETRQIRTSTLKIFNFISDDDDDDIVPRKREYRSMYEY